MIFFRYSFLLIFSLCVALFSSCDNGDSKPDGEDTTKADSTAMADTDSAEDANEVTYTLPSPLQVASIFKKSGLKYMPDITNPANNAVKYNNGNYIRAVNLGIYSSDLAYTVLNKQYQESKSYLKACRDIGVHLGLQNVFEANNLGKRFDKNIDREDSLIVLVSEMQLQSDIVLAESKQRHITAIAFAGAWIESMYIAAKVYSSDKNKKVSVSLLEQLTIAENIIKALEVSQTKEPACKDLVKDIKDILALFNNLEAIKNAEDKDEVDYSKINITEKELEALTSKITEIRTKLVN